MSEYVFIRRDEHEKSGYLPLANYSFAASNSLVPIINIELASVIQHMPLAFQKFGVEGEERFNLVALQSFEPNQNLFLHPDGRWLVGYKPTFYREYPFALRPGEKPNQLQLVVAKEHLHNAEGERAVPFFKDGVMSSHMQDVLKFLGETTQSRLNTLAICQSLHEAGVISPWEIVFDGAEGTQKVLKGLYHIDMKALLALPADKLAALNKSGALEVAYAQRLSETRLKDLTQLQEVHQKLKEQGKDNGKAAEVDLDKIFGESDDLFSF
ncbi:MAG: SapC family protein [Hahellaceae bacterium]|nr:SapC family protein [Hahellaceae bacterium]MCP5211297.1 SapC family protein [Hahellaceae bacterium]